MATRKGSYGPAAIATGPTTLITAPATEDYTVNLIWVSNPTAAAISVTFSIGADAAGTRIVGTNASANIPANSTKPFYGPFRIPASGILTASAGATGCVVTITYDRIPV